MNKLTKHGDYERVVKFDAWAGYTVHVVFTNNIPLSRKARYGTIGLSEDAHALHSAAKGGHAHLFFKLGNSPTGVIAHECWHAIFYMMVDWAGVKDMDNETTAYHLGHLVQEVADFRNTLIADQAYPEPGHLQMARALKSVGVKSSSRKQAVNGNQDTQGHVVRVQGVSAQRGGTSTTAGEAGTSCTSAQADGCGDAGYSGEATGRI